MNSSRWLALVMLVALSGCSGCGDKSSARSAVDSNQRNKALLQRLQTENVNYECEEIPLSDLFAWFSMNLDVEIKPSAEVQLDRAITIELHRNTIAAALDRLCLRYDLTWRVVNETIVVDQSPLAKRSAELLQTLRTKKSWIACEEEPLRTVFGYLARNGVEFEFDPDVDLSLVVSFRFPQARLCDLLDSLTEALNLQWVVYGGAVHIEQADQR